MLVTGTSGFIGGHLADALVASGHDVLGIDVLPPADPAPGYAVQHCDILDARALHEVFARYRPDAVCHLAAITDLIEPAPPDTYAANVAGVRHVLDAIAGCASVERLLCTSSQLVCRPGYVPRGDMDFAPDTPYGESKVQTELVCRELAGGGTTWCIVRPTTIWGPRMSPRYLAFYRMLQRGLYFHIGARPLLKSYGYVGNVVHQYMRLLAAPADAVHERVLYLADYEPTDLMEWAEAFRHALGGPPIRRMPYPLAAALAAVGDALSRLGLPHVPLTSRRLRNILTEYVFDLTQTERLCGPLPFSTQSGVQLTADWLRHELRAV